MIEIGADKLIVWDGLIDNLSGEYVNDATVTASVQELDGTELFEESIELDYIADSNGTYKGVLTAEMTEALTSCREYNIVLTAVGGMANGVRVLRELAINPQCAWLRFDHPYLSAISTSSDDQDKLTMMILAAQETIEQELGRSIRDTEHDELRYVSDNSMVYLKHFPIRYVSQVCRERVPAITLQNSTAPMSSASVDEVGVRLFKFASGTVTKELLTFADNPTIADMAEAIDALTGWTASAVATYEDYPSTALYRGGSPCKSPAILLMWEQDTEPVDYDPATGLVFTHYPRGSAVRFVYNAGFDDVPEPLKKIAADMVCNHFDAKAGAVVSESLGSYSYSLASMSEQMKRLPISNLKTLNSFKAGQVR